MYWVQLTWAGFDLTILVVIGTDYIGSCKSNYYVITTTTAPHKNQKLQQNYSSQIIKTKNIDLFAQKWFLQSNIASMVRGCFVDRCVSFCPFSFGHCVVCPSNYGFWLPLCYLQTLLTYYSCCLVIDIIMCKDQRKNALVIDRKRKL